MADMSTEQSPRTLVRGLSLTAATSLNIANMIGDERR
jgi:hypothetical protein